MPRTLSFVSFAAHLANFEVEKEKFISISPARQASSKRWWCSAGKQHVCLVPMCMRLCVVKKIYCNLHDWYVHMMIIIHITFYLTPIAYKTTIISNGKRTTQQQSCGSSVWGTVKCVSRTFFLLHHRVFSLNTKSAAAGRIGMMAWIENDAAAARWSDDMQCRRIDNIARYQHESRFSHHVAWLDQRVRLMRLDATALGDQMKPKL